ncbi:PP2C family protein-serine/threonine phosphatase [Caballeronia grimmiae]|uniref:PP2C family protein-serine/threonine phosphatase n=1 Tax=Caballeronia grimmiae TaxID=1071679 RepID=UPI0038BC68C1
MPFDFRWSSSKGRTSPSNDDYAGLAVLRSHALAVVIDGVSSRANSGALAQELCRRIIDKAVESRSLPSEQQARLWLRKTHEEIVQLRLGPAAAAYMIACFDEESVLFTLHAGDCRFGLVGVDGTLDWKTPIHSLATALTPVHEDVLAQAEGRNQLTRTFATRRFAEPEYREWRLAVSSAVVLGTDGFWASTEPETQALACSSEAVGLAFCQEEDSSVLLAAFASSFSVHCPDGTPNLYVKFSEF